MHTQPRGFVALISAVIISTVLLGLSVAIGSNTFFARFDALNREYKRLSLGFAESCVTTALGRIGSDYNYSVGSAVLVPLGTLYGKPAECTITSVSSGAVVNGKKTFTIATKASFNGAFSLINAQAIAQDPSQAPVTPPPTCAFNPTAVSVPSGQTVPFAWSTAGGGIISFVMDRGVGSLTPFSSGSGSFVAPSGPGTYTYTGTVTNAGGSNPCNIIVTVTPPPPAPSCADTMMVFDRSGSLSNSDLSNERNAGTSLTNLYAGVSSLPKIGAGSAGGLDGSDASVPVNGQLTTAYNTILSLINTITASNSSVGSNLGEEINVGANELNSVRHTSGKQKVLIFVSDGLPNQPSSVTAKTATSSPTANIQNGTGDLWSTPTNAYTDGSGDATDAGGHRHRFYNFNFPSIPSGSTITGITAAADAWSTPSTAPASTTLTAASLGAYDQWSANTGTRVSATQTNDGDSSYIDTGTSIETFAIVGAGVPAGSVINSVTITAVARGTAAGATMSLVAENGGAPNAGNANTLTTSYATYTRTMNTNPFTGNPWTLAEVNAWTTRFGISAPNNAASARVTQFSVTVNYTPGTPGTSGFKTPTSTHAPNNWDTNTVANVQSSNNVYASDNDNDQQGYSGFGFTVPANAVITGIDVSAEAKSSDNSGCQLAVAISQNGTNFNTPAGQDTQALTNNDATLVFGSANDLWGRTWTPAEVNSANFTVRVEGIDPGSSCSGGSTTSLDQLRANITYTVPGSPTNATVAATGVGGYDQWSTTSTDVSSVSTNDGDTSYIHNATNVETFAFANAGVPAGSTINSVTLTAVARGTASGAAIQLVAENGGAPNSSGNNNPLTTSYATYTRAMTTNPFTGNPWTLAEVNAWTTRFGVQTSNGAATPRVTQLSLKVDYTAPPVSSGCQLGVDLSWDGGNTWTSEKTATLTATETTFTLGSATDDWSGSHNWNTNEFSNTNFRARVRDIDPGASCQDAAATHLDWLRLQVSYSQPISASQYAIDASNAAKNAGVNIFSIHYGDANGQNFMGQLASNSTIAASSISTATRASGVATIQVAAAHHLTANQRVTVSGVANSAFNGTFTVTGTPTPSSFTYALSGSTVSSGGGTVTPTNLFISPASSAMTGIFQSIGFQICPAAAPSCSNTVDDDGDGLVDENDSGCHTDGNANNPLTYDPSDADEWTTPPAPTPPAPPPPPPTITIGSWLEVP